MSNSLLSPPQAATELLARRAARKGLVAFTEYTNPAYQPAAHHRLIAVKLEAVARGEITRLMILMPPRHGKSELASRRFPAWALGLNPILDIIAASYSSDLATDFGREVRNIVGSPEYRALFPTTLAADSQAANRWHTDAGGMYVAAGVGTSITGRGANILLIDDPFKDREDADSEIRRKRVWDWYTSTAYTRLAPGGAIVVINTRWHDDDLSGRLLADAEAGGDQWDVLSLPAIDEAGDPLWPDWYPLERLEQIRSVLPARDWNALYQQEPVPDEGEFFKLAWFPDYDELPERLNVYGASDYAVTDNGGDYSEHGVFGVDSQENVYVIDWWFGQASSDVWIESQCDLIVAHTPAVWFGESGVIRRAVEPFLVRRMEQRQAFCRMEWLPSISDKPARARGIQALASMGKVRFPKSAPWKGRLLAQLMRFPAAKNDDVVDVFGLIGRGMKHVHATPVRPPARRVSHSSSWMA